MRDGQRDVVENPPEPPEEKKKLTIAASEWAAKAQKVAVSFLTIAAEIAIVAWIGSAVGSHLNSVTVVNDCARVQIAKVGDTFVNCTVIEPKKDSANQPPR